MAKPIIRVFISYAQGYPSWAIESIVRILKQIKYHRGNLPYELYYWWDKGDPEEGGLVLGEDFNEQIEHYLKNADIILPLVTHEFFQSNYIQSKERPIIEARCKGYNSGVIPIIVGHTSYSLEWLGQYNLYTLPSGPENPLSDNDKHRRRAEKWAHVDAKLSDKFIGLAATKHSVSQEKQRREKYRLKEEARNEKPGCSAYIVLFLCFSIIGFGYYQKTSANSVPKNRRLSYYQEKVSREIIDFDNRLNSEEISLVDEFYEEEPNLPTSIEIHERNIFSKENEPLSKKYAEREKDNKHTETISVSPSKREAKNYGIYESCQGWDNNGFRPCKLERQWYIVNEDRNIHHRINFPIRTHKDIYAIRPFINGIAQVYFYNKDKSYMYIQFCVALDDEIVDCNNPNR